MAQQVKVDVIAPAPGNARVTKASPYDAMVTLSIEAADGSLTPSGWSTRKEHKGDGKPFSFTPGRNLIQGWTDGVLQMREGERALIHVPSALGYGAAPQGQQGGGWRVCAAPRESGARARAKARTRASASASARASASASASASERGGGIAYPPRSVASSRARTLASQVHSGRV